MSEYGASLGDSIPTQHITAERWDAYEPALHDPTRRFLTPLEEVFYELPDWQATLVEMLNDHTERWRALGRLGQRDVDAIQVACSLGPRGLNHLVERLLARGTLVEVLS